MRTSPAFATDDNDRMLNPARRPAFHLLIDIFPFPCFAPHWRDDHLFLLFSYIIGIDSSFKRKVLLQTYILTFTLTGINSCRKLPHKGE